MNVNKIKILNSSTDRQIIVPLSNNWDLSNREDSVNIQKEQIVKEIIGKPINYELARFSMKPLGNVTKIIYKFNFLGFGVNNYLTSYETTFTNDEIEFLSKGFSRSFFKLNFYNKIDKLQQKILFSVILTTPSGQKENEIYTTVFELDHFGIQEGYYLYWYEDESLFNLTELYFDCKFFNAKLGEFFQFINVKKNTLSTTGKVPQENFFYKLKFDYTDKTYQVFDLTNTVVNQLNWYIY